MVIVEYIWIDADGNTRSKGRTLAGQAVLSTIEDVPTWNFDGSSTKQADSSTDSEIILKPVALYNDPFRIYDYGFTEHCYLVLCECYNRYGYQLDTNTRYAAKEIFDKVEDHHPWYGLEQEYVLYSIKAKTITISPSEDCAQYLGSVQTKTLLGWPEIYIPNQGPQSQGMYYCGVGADRTFGRAIVEEHYNKCLKAGIKISGINEEVLPGQWEFQVGPCEGIDAADQLWVARYILHRVCEKHEVVASFEPKPVPGNWNGNGMHTNFSTIETRTENSGIDKIYEAIAKLKNKHKELISVCGDNTKRLTGTHETSKLDNFTFGVADRTASVRIPSQVNDVKCGYLEYRVPAADADPYKVTSRIAKTVLLD